MRRRTRSRRFFAAVGFATGSYMLGDDTTPASTAAAAVVLDAEVRARGRLDPVRAVAEVDRVEVLGEDLLLRPLAREVEGQRGLTRLLQDRPLALGLERDLHELLGDRRGTLRLCAAR